MPRWEEGKTPVLFRCFICYNPYNDSTRKPFTCKTDCRALVWCEECCKKYSSETCPKCKTALPNFQHYKEMSEYMNSAIANEDRTDQKFECQNCSLPFNDSDRKAFVCKLKCRKDVCCRMCIKLRPRSCCSSCETHCRDFVPYEEFQGKVREHEDSRMIKFKEYRRMLEKSEKQLLEYKDTMENIVKKFQEENEEQKKKIKDLEKEKEDFQQQLATAEEVNRNLEQKLEEEKNEKMEAEKQQIAYKDEMEDIVRKLENEKNNVNKLEEERNRLSDALFQREKLESEYVRETGREEELLSISKAANRLHDEPQGRRTTCSVCPDENNQDRLHICFECARNTGVDVFAAGQEEMQPFIMCSHCAITNHRLHELERYLPWKIKEVLRNSERKGAEIVTKMDEMCAQESRNAKECLDSWLQVVARISEKDGISFEDAYELSSELKKNALILFDSRRNNFADICRFTKAVKDSTERLLGFLPREEKSSSAEERLETVD